MLDAGGGGVGTSWATMSVPDMRRVIQSASTESQWEIVGGWQKSAELLLEHKFQVEDFRKNLAAAWPPAKSPASEAYLARLDALIKNLDETYEAALANHNALAGATGSIYQAQVKMEEIFKEYESNQTLLDQFTATQQKTQNGTPSPSPSPSGEEPPVAPGRQEQLRLQAVTMLSGVSTELAQAQARIVRPTKYEGKAQNEVGAPTDTGGFVPPPIPPIGLIPENESSASSYSSRAATAFPTTPNAVPPTAPQPATQPGLILGGAGPTPPPPPPPSTTPLTPALPSGAGPISGPNVLPPSTTFGPGTTPAAPPRGVGRGLPGEGTLRPGTPLSEGLRATPSGGVIGQNPFVGGLGQPGTTRPAVGGPRVNPVGGVIGSGSGAIQGGSAATHPGGVYGQGGNRRPSRRDETNGLHWDPDNPWETAEGVDPVVLPAGEQRIEPGPAIGLS